MMRRTSAARFVATGTHLALQSRMFKSLCKASKAAQTLCFVGKLDGARRSKGSKAALWKSNDSLSLDTDLLALL